MVLSRLYWNLRLRKWHRKKIDKLHQADVVILRYPKSGVTWLRVMISRIYQQRGGVETNHLIGSSEFATAIPDAPRVLIANDNMGMSNAKAKALFARRKVIMLIRDPRDMATSLYFHFTKRATELEHLSYGIPQSVRAMTIYDFMMSPQFGLMNIIRYLNYWTAALKERETAIVRYEDLHACPKDTLRKVMDVISPGTTADEIADAVEFASFEKMRQRESLAIGAAGILAPADKGDPDSFKVRRGKVGAYAEYLTEEQRKAVDSLVAEQLDTAIGYK
jgi:hypothetical protein